MAEEEKKERKGGWQTTKRPDGSWVRHKRGEGPNNKKKAAPAKEVKKPRGGK